MLAGPANVHFIAWTNNMELRIVMMMWLEAVLKVNTDMPQMRTSFGQFELQDLN